MEDILSGGCDRMLWNNSSTLSFAAIRNQKEKWERNRRKATVGKLTRAFDVLAIHPVLFMSWRGQ